MIIGFGTTEKQYEEATFKIFEEIILDCISEDEKYGFSDKLISLVKQKIKFTDEEGRLKSDEYKNAKEYPGRYSYQYSYVLGDCNYIAVIVNFSHINRRHALSPDGWAMMKNQETFVFYHYEISKKKKELAVC